MDWYSYYYVYTLAYPDGTVFYVGKGCRHRIEDHFRETRRGVDSPKCNIIRSIWANGQDVVIEKVYTNLSEEEALKREQEVIDRFDFGSLANRCKDGCCKWVTPEYIEDCREKAKTHWKKVKESPDWIEKIPVKTHIPQETLDALKESAKREHRSINAQLVLFIEQGLEREKDMAAVILQHSATLEQAAEAKSQGYVVLADWTGRRVTINSLIKNEQTGEWSAEWSHSDYPGSRWDSVDEDQRFIIRGPFGCYR